MIQYDSMIVCWFLEETRISGKRGEHGLIEISAPPQTKYKLEGGSAKKLRPLRALLAQNRAKFCVKLRRWGAIYFNQPPCPLLLFWRMVDFNVRTFPLFKIFGFVLPTYVNK